MAQAALGVAALLVVAALYAATCARKALREVRAAREDIRRLHGALEVLALLFVQRPEGPSAATPIEADPAEASDKDDEDKNPLSDR